MVFISNLISKINETTTLTVFLSTFFVATLLLYLRKRRQSWGQNPPPGPFSIPLIGHYFKQGLDAQLYYDVLKKKYGNIFSFYLGTKYTLVLNDFETIKEAANSDVFTGRPTEMFKISPDYQTLIEMDGTEWREHRRFSVKALRSLGMGKTQGENAAKTQILHFLERLKKEVGKDSVDIQDFVNGAVRNIIFTMICNKTFEDDEKAIKQINDYLKVSAEKIFENYKLNYIPWLMPLIAIQNLTRRKEQKKVQDDFDELLRKEIKSHENSSFDNSDYMDYYLEHMRQPDIHPSFTMSNLVGNSHLFLFAGSETTNTLLSWCFVVVAENQDIQERMYKEIINVVGKERLPQWEDRLSLPYTEAVLLEVERWKTQIPINDARITLADTTIRGYDVPKGTITLFNLWAVHNDPHIWGDPENFRPERFLSDDQTKINRKVEYVVTFSLGKRSCPGERLAKVQSFLYFTSILQKFKIVPPKNGMTHKERAHFGPYLTNLKIALKLRE